jgi:FkbM family methyltransferase
VINNFKPDVALVGNIDFLGVHIFDPFLSVNIPIINHLGFDRPLYSLEQKPTHPLYHLSACSHYVKNRVDSLGFDFDDVSVVYPGAYVDDFYPVKEKKFDKLEIIYAGIVSPYKGPQVLVEALAILQNEGLDFDCILAGVIPEPNFLAHLEEIITTNNMQAKVKFIGYKQRKELINLYRDRNVFVFPSVWDEPFGIAQVEGMAAGLATISSATGGSSEIIEHGVSGLRFERNNSLSLAFCLLSLVTNHTKWKSLSEQGVKRAKESFDIYHSVDLLEAKFSELLVYKNLEVKYLEELNNKETTKLEDDYQIGDLNYLIIPNWQAEEEALINELGDAIKKILNSNTEKRITLFVEPTGIELDILESYLSNILLSLMLEEKLSAFDKLTIYPWSLAELKDNKLFSNVQGKFLIEHENPQLAEQLKQDQLPVIYAVRDILLKIPTEHPLPKYQKKFRFYDKFIAVLAKNLPDTEKLIIDIGANVGDTAALLLQYCQNPILSIEADNDYFNFMLANLSDYRERLYLVNSFVAGTEKEIGFQLIKQPGTARAVASQDPKRTVKSRSLDSIVSDLNLGESILLKTDTDGFDYEIVLSSTDFIMDNRPIVYWIKSDEI